jgi:hypothetical protein
MPSSNGSLVIAVKMKAKEIFASPPRFTLYKNVTLTEVAYFSMSYYHIKCQGPILSGASVAQTSKVCAFATLLPIIGH